MARLNPPSIMGGTRPRLNPPYMQVGEVGGSSPGDNPPSIYAEGAEPLNGLKAFTGYVPGKFGPESNVQGAFGRDLSASKPLWAKWFDQVHAAAPGGIAGIGAGGGKPLSTSVQPGKGDYTTWGLPAGYTEERFNQEVQGTEGGTKLAPFETETMLPDVQQRFAEALRGLKRVR